MSDTTSIQDNTTQATDNNKHQITMLTPEQREEYRLAAQEERNRKIQVAIENGAKVTYLTTRLSEVEKETIINIFFDGSVIVDTTIPRDITKYLKKDIEIVGITYSVDKTVAGVTFKTKRNILHI